MDPLETIYNYLRHSDRLATSGQPTETQLALVRDAGFETVVNLLPENAADSLPDEGAIVEELGLEYVSIPVIWVRPEPSDFDAFCASLETNRERRLFVHCAANMRVSAFLYLYRTTRLRVPALVAAADLHRIWRPNQVWQAFIERIQRAAQ